MVLETSPRPDPLLQTAVGQFEERFPGMKVSIRRTSPGAKNRDPCSEGVDVSAVSLGAEAARRCGGKDGPYTPLQVANQAVAVVTHKALPIDCLTVSELRRLWRRRMEVGNYSEVGPRLPNQTAMLFGAAPATGPFDLFAHEVGPLREDYSPSSDDAILVQAVATNPGAVGFLGFPAYDKNRDKVNVVAIDDGRGCVKPSTGTIQSGDYRPLSRPLFVRVRDQALERPPVETFARFMLDAQLITTEAAQAVPMSREQVGTSYDRLDRIREQLQPSADAPGP